MDVDYLELMKERHSVRQYLDKPIDKAIAVKLQERIDEINKESGLTFKLILNEPKAFDALLPKYGSFKNVTNYVICSGPKMQDFDEKVGYYGEDFVLYAQSLGLSTCWVGASVKKSEVRKRMFSNEKLGCVIAFGYGANTGFAHKNKDVAKVTLTPSPWPEWFKDGMMGAMLAPTAINQQRFKINIVDGKVSIVSTGGFYSKVDLGIVKYQFEKAAGKDFPGFSE